MHKQIIWLSLCLLFIPVLSYSGETSNYNYKYFQLGSGIYQIANTHLSPLAYQGSGINLQSGSCRNWEHQLRRSSFIMDVNYYSHPNKKSSLQGGDFMYQYFRYYQPQVPLPYGAELFIGGGYNTEIEILSNPVNINNSIFYSFNNSLNIGFLLAKKWDDYFFSNEFTLPIVGVYSASEYGSSFPYRLYHDDIPLFSKAHVGSLNLNSIFRNSFNFDVIAHTKRKKTYNLRFNYTIVYGRQQINNIKHTKAFHQIGVGLLFNTKHHEY